MTGAVLVAGVLVTAGTSALAQAVLPSLLRRARVVDVPSRRSSHREPTPRGGGLAVLAGLVAGGATWRLLHAGGGTAEQLVTVFVGAAVVAGALGLVEDVRGVPAPVRLLLQLVIGAVVGATVVHVLGASAAWVVLSAAAVATYVNAVNFMDGVDTITAGHGTVCGLTYAAAGALAGPGTAWLVPAGLLLATASAMFSLSNGVLGAPARMFLGDVGSYAVGAGVAVLAGAGLLTGLPVLTALAPTTVWLADTGHTLLLRAAAGEPLSQAHRTHAYQRLTDSGWSHRRVGAAATAVTAVCGGLGLAALAGPGLLVPVATALLVLAWAWVELPAWRGRPSPWGAVAKARRGGGVR